MREQIAPTPENAKAVRDRYYGKPALFMEEILGMDLDEWQRELCDEFHQHNRHAISSGHSSGKSAFTAGIIQYFICVHSDPQIIVTANTEKQLAQKTWRELAKWWNNSLVKDWFEWSATTFSLKGAKETWFAAAVPNTPHNSESFAGAHEKYVLQVFDEASAVERSIWEVAEGATATEGGYRKWLVFGNPTRPDGAFYDCFHKRRHRWNGKYLDTRKCKYADQKQIAEWAEDYGEDSDFFRVRVRGLFPQQAVVQLIGRGLAEDAAGKHIPEASYWFAPKILTCDVARFGDDATVIFRRQGLKTWKPMVMRGRDTMYVAEKIAHEIQDWSPQAVFVDETGLGAGVVDRLRQLKYKVTGVNGSNSPDDQRHLNKRMEMWWEMREWLESGGCIPDDQQLIDDLTAPEYFVTGKGKMQLESKDSIKLRGLPSPDHADALGLSFAYPVQAAEPERLLSQAEKDWRKITGMEEMAGTSCVMD